MARECSAGLTEGFMRGYGRMGRSMGRECLGARIRSSRRASGRMAYFPVPISTKTVRDDGIFNLLGTIQLWQEPFVLVEVARAAAIINFEPL